MPSSNKSTEKMMPKNPKKIFYLMLGWLFLALGVIGIPLPILPTTPFLILAAYFFSKSSKKLHDWLVSNPQFGHLIKDWEHYGAIRPKAKWAATILIIVLFGISFYFVNLSLTIKIILIILATIVIGFIQSRPNGPQKIKSKKEL